MFGLFFFGNSSHYFWGKVDCNKYIVFVQPFCKSRQDLDMVLQLNCTTRQIFMKLAQRCSEVNFQYFFNTLTSHDISISSVMVGFQYYFMKDVTLSKIVIAPRPHAHILLLPNSETLYYVLFLFFVLFSFHACPCVGMSVNPSVCTFVADPFRNLVFSFLAQQQKPRHGRK